MSTLGLSTSSSDCSNEHFAPRIYYFHPLMGGPFATWSRHIERSRDMGFDHFACAPLFAPGSSGDIFLTANYETIHPALLRNEPADELVGLLARMCHESDLALHLDVVFDRIAADAELTGSSRGWFRTDNAEARSHINPSAPLPRRDTAYARFEDPSAAKELAALWIARLQRLTAAGVAGFLCRGTEAVPSSIWREIVAAVRRELPACRFLAWTPGLAWPVVLELRGAGFDAVFSSLPWWDERKSWLIDEYEVLRQVGSVIACPEAPFGARLARNLGRDQTLSAVYLHKLRLAAAAGPGLMVPMGFEFASPRDMDPRRSVAADFDLAEPDDGVDLRVDIRATNALAARISALGINGEMRALTGHDGPVTTILRADHSDVRHSSKAIVVVINTDLQQERPLPIMLDPLPPASGAGFDRPVNMEGNADPTALLDAAEIRLVLVQRVPAIKSQHRSRAVAQLAHTAPRIVIDQLRPA